MELQEIARRIDAELLAPGRQGCTDVQRVYAGDRMSDLLGQASADTLLVSRLSSAHVLRVAHLMDVPGVCLADSAQQPKEDVVRLAGEQGTALMVTRLGVKEVIERLRPSLPISTDVRT